MARQDHFMRTEIVESQFKSLQFLKVDEKDVLTIDAVIRSKRRWLWLGNLCRSGRPLKNLVGM